MNTNPEILYRNFEVLSGGEQVKILLVSLFLCTQDIKEALARKMHT